jgi:hypothetical protein
MSTLLLVPISLKEANAFVGREHRHHPHPTRGHKFSVAVATTDGVMRGVAIAGRPVSRMLDDGITLEVLRVATDGTPNACSKLYSAIRRAAIAMGYPAHRVITYTLASESGRSLHAAGWVRDADTKGGSWNRTNRPREDKASTECKVRWTAAKRPALAARGEGEPT